jgi:hypothetical protein
VNSNCKKYNEVTHYKVINAYLHEGLSHRRIQLEILNLPAPVRGGGFEAMNILHNYNIDGSKKGILKNRLLSEEQLSSEGMYKLALELIEKYK